MKSTRLEPYTKARVNILLDLLFPPRCYGCGRVGRYICRTCQKQVTLRDQLCPECDRPAMDGLTHPGCRRSYGLDGLMTVFRYEGVVKKAIKAIKYRFVYDATKSLVDLVPQTVIERLNFLQRETVFYPIPLHSDRLKWRGFNQAEKLGEILSRRLNFKRVDRLLIRSHKRTPQADIEKREQRIKNTRGIYTLGRERLPAHVLLIDDIWTTGATMKEAAMVLKRGGVKKVWALTLAR